MLLSKIKFQIVRLRKQTDHLNYYLEDLIVLLPILLSQLLEQYPVALVLRLGLTDIYVVNRLFEVALQRTVRVLVWNINIQLQSLSLIWRVSGSFYKNSNLLNKFEVFQHDIVD